MDDEGAEDDLRERVAALEETVERLHETVERQRRTVGYLAIDADLDAVEAVCPECGGGGVSVESGLTWRRVRCPDCGLQKYL